MLSDVHSQKVARASKQRQNVIEDYTDEPDDQTCSGELNLLRNGSQSRRLKHLISKNVLIVKKKKFKHTRDKETQCRETLTLNMTNYESASLIKSN